MNEETEDPDLKPFIKVEDTYKSFRKILQNVLVITLGSFYFGYTLTYISTIPIVEVMNYFKIEQYVSSPSNVQGILSGIIPVGGGIGALLSSIVNKRLSRRNGVVFTAGLSIVGTSLVLISSFFTFIIGRAIQGICVGLHSVMVPLFISEYAPMQISGRLGSLHQLMITSGIVLTNVIALFVPNIIVPDKPIISEHPIWNNWWIIFGMPLIIALIQIILLVLIFKNETPRYLYTVDRNEDALQLIKEIYKQEYIEEIVIEKKTEVDRIKKMSVTSIMTSNDDSYLVWKSKKLCILVAVHLAILKQMCGVNAVVLYGSGIINKAVNNPQLSKWMQLFLIVSQLVACIGASYTLKRVGRKSLLQIGTGTSFIVLTIIGVAFVAMDNNIAQQILVITSLFVFMTIFCFTIPVVWLYIPEIVPAEILPYTTMSNWAGASITIILFPILGQTVGIGYLFFVFSLWCLLAFMFNYKYVVETKGKTERQIKKEFDQLVS